ncbi:LysR family transcriptional regulator [Stappia sp. F7233]|uniref:LysR family transcriptional regulator n=1 Tax=Stappia albiluteola TaxID=2758565 RepID=A0A839A9F8_9HYPH|nr:LysR substrate-binding domain-containing protein [Stappia albiluteola]MBA5775765.1 LysR family transcriptional regulator [Stappia albiluteola]
MVHTPTLDIDLLRTFVATADATGFTAAGQTIGASQSAISMRIRKLEDRLGQRLMDRDPRSVRLTSFGASFLEDARLVLDVHDRAARRASSPDARQQFSLAVSDHAAGALLPALIAGLQRSCPEIRYSVTVCSSDQASQAFRNGEVDAAISRRDSPQSSGFVLFRDQLIWLAAKDFILDPDQPLPFLSYSAHCSVRKQAIKALEAAGISWIDAFTGTGVAAVQAAATAGLGVACLDARNLPSGCRILGPDHGLPPLPSNDMLLHCRTASEYEAPVRAIRETFGKIGRKPIGA